MAIIHFRLVVVAKGVIARRLAKRVSFHLAGASSESDFRTTRKRATNEVEVNALGICSRTYAGVALKAISTSLSQRWWRRRWRQSPNGDQLQRQRWQQAQATS